MEIILENQNGNMIDLSAYKGKKICFFIQKQIHLGEQQKQKDSVNPTENLKS